MAYANIDERRDAVRRLWEDGATMADIRTSISEEYSCTKSAVDADLVTLGIRTLRAPHGNVVYSLSDPRTNEVRYVGKSVNVKARFNAHLSGYSAPQVREWIQTLRDADLRPVLTILETVRGVPLNEREQWWIAEMKRQGARLLNTHFCQNREPQEVHSIVLSVSDWRAIEDLGDGNRSAGIRALVDAAREEGHLA